MILILLTSDSVGMIYMRSNLDDNLTWVLGVHIWHSEGAINEKYWFGLHRGCVTSTWPKLKCTPQNFPACKISGHFIHWGPFYGTPLSENLDFAPPLYIKSYVLISYLMRSLKLKQFVNVCVGVVVYALGWHWPSRQICYSLCTSNFIYQQLKQIPTYVNSKHTWIRN